MANITNLNTIEDLSLTSFNSTNSSTSVNDQSENYHKLKIVVLFIEPLISCIGIIGNCLTFIVLRKEGIKKPSNIIILSLTLADCLYLIRSVNAFHLLARFGHPNEGYYGWETSIEIGYLIYILDKITFTVENWGGYVATNIPVVITVERFIAVFFPLKFKQIMTFKKVLLIIIAIWVFWLPWIFSSMFHYTVGFTTKVSGTMFVYIHLSQMLKNGIQIISFFDDYFFNIVSSIVPVSLVSIGCILIGVKIRLSQIKRKSLGTPNKAKSLRTTRTLLSVSMDFAIIHLTYFILSAVFESEFFKITVLAFVLGEIKSALVLVCASCNFFVYIILNPSFRQTLRHMLSCKTFTQI